MIWELPVGGASGCLAPSFCLDNAIFSSWSSSQTRVWMSSLLLVVRRARVSLKRLLSHVECHNQYLDRRSRYRPVVLYACRCFFWDLFSFPPRYGAALSVSRGGVQRRGSGGVFEVIVRVVVVVPLLLITSLWQRRNGCGSLP